MASEDDIDMSRDDLYEIVGCERTATREEIRRAYRRKARQLHPDVTGDPNSAKAFRRLVAAFETIMDESKRGAYETQRKRSNARERAERQWNDVSRRGWSSSSSSSTASERPAGSRREAEAASKEESERRRQRWREMAFEDIWRDHMPLDYDASRAAAGRVAFVSALEVTVQAFVRGKGQQQPQEQQQQHADRGGVASGVSPDRDPEAAETAELIKLTNREVLRSELADARHRTLKHRERVRWLEAELELANKKAAMYACLTEDRPRLRDRTIQLYGSNSEPADGCASSCLAS